MFTALLLTLAVLVLSLVCAAVAHHADQHLPCRYCTSTCPACSTLSH